MKLYSKKKVTQPNQTDSVLRRWNTYGKKYDPELLGRFYTAWMNLSKFREERDRCLRYVYGDQWSDTTLQGGHYVSESEHIRSQGSVPLVNNVMRSLINAVTGVYAKQDTEPVCFARNRNDQGVGDMMTTALQCNWQINKERDLLLTVFEEMLNSGAAITRETYEFRDDSLDTYTDACNPYYMVWEGGSDPRHTDISLIGQLHDMDFNTLCAKFCNPDTGLTVQDIRELFLGAERNRFQEEYAYSHIGLNEKNKLNNVSFYSPARHSDFRVYEIWTKEIKERIRCIDRNAGEVYKVELNEEGNIKAENQQRIRDAQRFGIPVDDVPLIETERFIDCYWYYHFLTPSGHVLLEGETPYDHKSHPYTIKLYPFVNGEVHSFAATFIDQQRYINRLITLNDFILRTSAKGVTIIPETVLGDMKPEEFAEQWTRADGLIFYKPKPGTNLKPEVFYNNSSSLGINEMLQLQLGLIDRISSVQGALQGKAPSSGTSASRYAMETQNATASLSAILQKFTTFTEDIAKKKVKVMQQFYEDGRYISISPDSDIRQFDANKVRDVEFYMSIRESAASPVHEMVMNDWLKELWLNSGGLITVEDMLKFGRFPFADKLLQDIEVRKSQMQGAAMQGAEQGAPQQLLTPDMQRQIGADQQAYNRANKMLMQYE